MPDLGVQPVSVPAVDTLDPAVRELLAVFAGPLAEVSFPGVDGRQLAALARQVDDDAGELARVDAAAQTLRQRLAGARDELHQRAQRALAYARVYAETDGGEELAARLAALVLPRARTQRVAAPASVEPDAPRKRGRPRKEASPPPTSLFTIPSITTAT